VQLTLSGLSLVLFPAMDNIHRSGDSGPTLPPMPWAAPQKLTEAQEKRLRAAEARIQRDRLEWAKLVRSYGISASARAYGISPQAMLRRVQVIERGSA
jgi:hypothetical protein